MEDVELERLKKVISRVIELADKPMEYLHSSNPDIVAETRNDTVRGSRQIGYTRGEIIGAILEDEFLPHTD